MEKPASAGDPGGNVGSFQVKGSRSGGLAGGGQGGRHGEGEALVQQRGWAMGVVRMRVTRQETGTGKRQEPTGICIVEL